MKLVIVTEYFPDSKDGEITGGVEARAFYMAQELCKDNDILIITSWRKGLKRRERIGSINVERVGPNHGYSNKGGFISRFKFAWAAYKTLKTLDHIDVVDGFNFTTYLPAYYGARKIKAKAIATYHETWLGEWIKNKGLITGLVGEILERLCLSCKWDLILPVSNFTKNKLKEKGISEKKLEVVYNGVITDDFEKLKVKKEKDFTLVCVSRLIKTKRQETILKALKELNDTSVKLILVGAGDDSEYYKKKVKEMNLEKQVSFTGFLKTKEEVIEKIKKSHVLVHPSAVEGFGITVIEGMAAELPVIVSDIPPLKEVTANGAFGLIFELDNYKDLAKKIKLLKDNKEKYEYYKEQGTKRVKDFSWKGITKKYLKTISK